MASQKRQPRKARASHLCAEFEGTELVGCARAGLAVLEVEHKAVDLWVWVAAPPADDAAPNADRVFFLRQSPAAHRLAEAGILFPIRSLPLP